MAGVGGQEGKRKTVRDAGAIELEIDGVAMRVGRGADDRTVAAVIGVRRPNYACRGCEDVVLQAPAPTRLIEGGLPTMAVERPARCRLCLCA